MIDNDIVFTNFGSKVIRRVTPSGTENVICSTAPLHPVDICKSYDGGLLVTLCSCNVSEITSGSYGEIHHIDKLGGIIRKYTHTEDNRNKLFTYPNRVAQNINTDLCVVDIIDKEFRSRLVVLSLTSKIRFIYTGQPDMTETFSIKDVCCDHQGRILLNCLLNHVVILLSEEGVFLQYLLTRQSPLFGPRSLGLHGDKLWVGCEKGVVRVYNYNQT
ncbi:hypothetical protein FSP39_017951 [Pinctada imbricata]|uniref:Uncharacterized protein n=1 Tax=Pinctada imbricata TaxID=66713 RepID=A0AA88YV68_PINIB|nr:hypothetical protein FSP39_017951 [Pinctada imbricata]